jgi:hydrogenase nickel incorporation protein HypA/HybF
MHELALASSVVEIVEEQARAQGFKRVRVVRLEVGKLAGVEPEAMRFCFDAATRGTVAGGARLEIIEPPGAAWCLPCERPIEIDALGAPCPHCGRYQLQVTGGIELRVRELEVE